MSMTHIEEDPSNGVEIDEITYNQIITELEKQDPFENIKFSSLSPKMKRKFNNLQKKLTGNPDSVGTKYIDPEQIVGYSLFDVVYPPYDQVTLASLFDQSAIHNAAVNARAMNTVGLGYEFEETPKARRKIERVQDDEAKLQRMRKALHDERDRLDELFDTFNDEETFLETMIRIWLDTLTTGNGYMEISRTIDGKIGYIGHVPSLLVRVRRKRDGFVQMARSNKIQAVFFRNFQDTETEDPINNDQNPNEMIHFKLYSPNNTYYGIPPAVSAATAIVGDKFAKEYNIDYFENKAIPRYAIIVKGAKLSAKSKQELINYFRNEVKGRNHGTLVIPIPSSIGSDADIKFEKLEAGIQDASFDKYRKSNRDEILVANRVPAPKVGVYDNANLAVSRDADKTFKTQVIGPDQAVIEKKLNRIVAEFSDLLVLKFKKIDLIDEDIQSRIYDRYLRTEVLTPNEVRADLNRPERLEGDDVLPFPTKVKKDGPGAPPMNSNNGSAFPPKSRADSASVDGGDGAVDNGDQAERGQNQDSGENTDN